MRIALINKIIIFSFLTVTVLLTGTIAGPMELIQSADALKSSGNPVSETNSKKVCGDRLCSEIPKEVKSEAKKKEKIKTEKKESEQKKIEEKLASEKARYDELSLPPRTIKTDTITSTQDPGLGHENHQLAIILPPSEKVYRGMLTFTSSEDVQLVALVGPLKEGEDKGQAIWTPDGKTFYAFSFVDKDQSMGTWQFTGNAVALHTMNDTPFTVSYSVATGQ